MLTCKQVSELVSQSIDRRLSLRERIGVRLHLLICRMCSRVKKQMEFIHRAAKEYADRGGAAVRQLQLSPGARERIRAALRSAEQ